MADPTDSPRGAAVPFPVSSVSAPPPTETGEEHDYHPLSILAIAALGVAGVYALVMAVCAIVAFFQRQPLIHHWATAVIPLAGAALALVAWLQIQRSEGALSGRKLALAGGVICVLVGLVYWSYYLATLLAIRQGADAVGRAWIDNVAKGNLATAYWYILHPAVRPNLPTNAENDPVYRNALETRLYTGEAGGASFSQFCRRDEVHFVLQAGQNLVVEPLGVTSWDYSGTGYVVRQSYRLTGPQGSVEVGMTVHGDEAKRGEFVGRQWYIEPERLVIDVKTIRWSGEGRRALGLTENSRQFVDEWIGKLSNGAMQDAYLDTLPATERVQATKAIFERVAAADCLLLAATPCNPGYGPWLSLRAAMLSSIELMRDAVPGYREFAEGGIVQVDRKHFWVPVSDFKPDEPGFKEAFAKKQDEMVNEVKALFAHPGADFGQNFEVNRAAHMSMSQLENGVFSAALEFSVSPRMTKDPQTIDARLIVECPEADIVKRPPFGWRIARIELQRSRPMTGPPGRRGRPGPGGMMPDDAPPSPRRPGLKE
jgi:hypothetical protein